MSKIGIFYASAMGNTEAVALDMQQEFGMDTADVIHVADADKDMVSAYTYLVIGGSTWGTGEIQDDMADFMDMLDEVKLENKKVALYGLGDQVAYPAAFADSLGDLYDKMVGKKARIVGEWPLEGYEFKASRAERNGKFVGLVLDVDNQPDKTHDRISQWVGQLREAFGV